MSVMPILYYFGVVLFDFTHQNKVKAKKQQSYSQHFFYLQNVLVQTKLPKI